VVAFAQAVEVVDERRSATRPRADHYQPRHAQKSTVDASAQRLA
jgi:hypothetical protein